MATEKSDKGQDRAPESDSFLAMVDAKIAALHALRASYVAAVSVGAFGQGGDSAPYAGAVGGASGLGGAPLELPRGALLGKSFPAAIKLYLSAIKKKQTIREIANALRDAGVETTAKNFENPVQSAIYRLQTNGEVLRFKEGWALAEFYPENLRNRIAEKNDTKPKKAKKRSAKAKSKSGGKSKAAPAAGAHGTEAAILAFLQQNGKSAPASAVAAAVNAPTNVVGLALGRMKVQGKVVKGEDGNYAATA